MLPWKAPSQTRFMFSPNFCRVEFNGFSKTLHSRQVLTRGCQPISCSWQEEGKHLDLSQFVLDVRSLIKQITNGTVTHQPVLCSCLWSHQQPNQLSSVWKNKNVLQLFVFRLFFYFLRFLIFQRIFEPWKYMTYLFFYGFRFFGGFRFYIHFCLFLIMQQSFLWYIFFFFIKFGNLLVTHLLR